MNKNQLNINKLPFEEKTVLSRLINHEGIENAIKLQFLSDQLNLEVRTLENIIASLRIKGFPVGSSKSNVNGGIYIANSVEEIESTIIPKIAMVESLTKQIQALQKTMKELPMILDYLNSQRIRTDLGQLDLFTALAN